MSAEPLSLFGSLLRRHRAAAGLTQEELAERAGLSARAISDLERGIKRAPRKDTVALLTQALGLTPRQRDAFTAAARPGAAASAGPEVESEVPDGLPVPLTALVGREGELREALARLERAEVRLLTLTGPGGVGKSRLALEVAREASNRFDDGVYLVELAPLREPSGVIPAIAAALGLRESIGTPLDEQLRAHLRPLRALLLLDNFEHLLVAAPLIAALLATAPRCTALVTSREALRIHGEHELPVAPLAADAAAEMFLARVRACGVSLDPDQDTRALAEAICGRVDCLPLAIELAAVRARALPLPVLFERLSQRLDLLSSGLRDLPDRQRTMRDAVAWSHHLLDAREQRLFRRLSVFAGGWTLEAAETICGEDVVAPHASGGDSGRGEVLETLASLVEKSLVLAEAHTPSRFAMLETIREYARDCLDEAGEAEQMRRRHAEYYARLADGLLRLAPNQDAQDRALERELPNARAAMEWARDRGEMALGLRLIAGFARLWFIRGALSEAEGRLRTLLAADAAAPGPRRAPSQVRVTALFGATRLALNRRDFDEAEALANEGLSLAERAGDAGGAANMVAELGHVAEGRGDLDTALARFEQSLALARLAGDASAEARAISSLGNLARARRDYQQARRYLEDGLVTSRERRNSWAVAGGFASLGHVAVEEADFSGAAEQYRKSLDLYREMPNPAWLAWWAQGVVALAEAGGDHQRAARLAGAIAKLRAAAASQSPERWAPFERALDAARSALGEHTYEAELAEGAQLSVEQTFALAQRILTPRADT